MWGMIVALGLLATGCEWARWMRLLSFKNQLAKLDRYVKVEDQAGLRLRLLKPVVYADDLSLLIDGETARTTNGNQITWLWSYEKQSAGTSTETGDFGMSFTMSFKDQKLSELDGARNGPADGARWRRKRPMPSLVCRVGTRVSGSSGIRTGWSPGW